MAFFEYDLGDRKLTFEHPGHIANWVGSEQSFWSSFSAPQAFNGIAIEVIERQRQYFKELTNMVNKAVADQSSITRPGGSAEKDALMRTFARMHPDATDRILCRDVEDDAFLLLLEKDPAAAAAGLYLRAGIENRAIGNDPKYRDAELRFVLRLNLNRGQRTELKIKATVEEARSQYLHTLATDGLIAHWKERADDARRRAISALIVFAVAAIGVVIAILYVLHRALPDGFNKGSAEALLPLAPVSVICAVPMIWALRHLSRMYLDYTADARDAELRHVMAQSYVAMLASGNQQPQQQERAIILSALFRPGASQPPEEGVPLPLIELLKK
jgi:hypothetical protein